MEFIKPNEISGKIITLLDESSEFVIIVSPYVKISKWYKLINKIKDLKNREVELCFFVRDDEHNLATFLELDSLGVTYYKVPNLHCKFYLNESKAIMSSMNLLLSSEINSLDLGYQTETVSEYNELYDIYDLYLKRHQVERGDDSINKEEFSVINKVDDAPVLKKHDVDIVKTENGVEINLKSYLETNSKNSIKVKFRGSQINSYANIRINKSDILEVNLDKEYKNDSSYYKRLKKDVVQIMSSILFQQELLDNGYFDSLQEKLQSECSKKLKPNSKVEIGFSSGFLTINCDELEGFNRIKQSLEVLESDYRFYYKEYKKMISIYDKEGFIYKGDETDLEYLLIPFNHILSTLQGT